ncbi:MAG: tetratricopeptide repeat protein [Candidatus Latescibacterota bacterium]|nr:tetratricopeptide repeat protein [Candidatus Latescibacterota bacterium]
MLLINLLTVVVMGAAVSLTTRYFSPQELQDRFGAGQTLYALGDYEKSIGHFRAVLKTKSNATINVDEVSVTLDDFILPVRVAAMYQLGNAHNKLGQDKLRRSGYLRKEGKQKLAEERYSEALADFETSLKYFGEISSKDDVDERTRVMAQFQTLETNYKLKQYQEVIEEGSKLLEQFPNSVYETAAMYNIGWSFFELGSYDSAIDNFEQVITLSPRGSHADRSYFQIAESYEKLNDYDQALEYLERLIGRYDFSAMSEKELIDMASMKLKGLVEETSRELVAKAQLRRGDILAQRGDVEDALAVFAGVPAKYPMETALVQSAYLKTAELIESERGTEAGILAYKSAIENVDDKRFQAKIQVTIGRLYYDVEEYEKAAEEYRIFLNAYGDVAVRIGFAPDKVYFRIAQCYQMLTRSVGLSGDSPGQEAYAQKALELYNKILTEHSESSMVPDVHFSIGYVKQLQKDSSAEEAYQFMVDNFSEHPAAPNALQQLARLSYERGEYNEARERYEKLVSKYPESDVISAGYMELGLTMKYLDDIPQAIAYFEKIDPNWPQWAKVQAELADLHVRAGQMDQAKSVLVRAMNSTKDEQLRGQLLYVKSRIHFADGEYSESIAGFGKSMQLPVADDIVDGALLSRGSAQYELAKELDAKKDTASAREHYEASLIDMKALLERDPAPNIKDSAFRTLGAGMIRLEREEEAVRYYSELIDASSDLQQKATFQMLLVELYFDQQQYEMAESFARKLLEMEFEDDNSAGYFRKERAYSIIGNALLKRKQYVAASAVFGDGLNAYPNSGESANLAFSRAFADFNQGAYEKSAKGFDFYVNKFRDDRNSVHGQYYLGHSYQVLTQFDRAGEAFGVLLELYPNSSYSEEAIYLIGENYYNRRIFDQAAESYRKQLDRFPQGRFADSALYALAWCEFEQENMKDGVAAMELLVLQYPKSEFAARAQFTVGDYHYNNKEYDSALTAYSSLITNYPREPEASKAQRLVDELNEIEASQAYKTVMAQFEGKQYESAIKGFKEIIEKYPETYTQLAAYCNLGLTYEILRQWPEAVENYDNTLKMGSGDIENSDVVNFAKLHRDWIVENRL